MKFYKSVQEGAATMSLKEFLRTTAGVEPPPQLGDLVRILNGGANYTHPHYVLVDGSLSMVTTCSRAFYGDIARVMCESPAKDIQVTIFGEGQGEQRRGGFGGTRDVNAFLECVGRADKTHVATTCTDPYVITERLRVAPSGNKISVTILSDGEFDSSTSLVNSIRYNEHKIASLTLVIVGSTDTNVQRVKDKLSSLFAKGLEDTSLTVTIVTYSESALETALQISSPPTPPPGFLPPQSDGAKDWVTFSAKTLANVSDDVLNASLRRAPPELIERMTRVFAALGTSLTHVGQVSRLAGNEFLQIIWRVLKALHRVTRSKVLGDVIDAVTRKGSSTPALSELLQGSKVTNVHLALTNLLYAYAASIGGTVVRRLGINKDPTVDTKTINSAPTPKNVAAVIGSMLLVRESDSDSALDNSALNHCPLLPLTVAATFTNKEFAAYVSLLFAVITGTPMHQVSGLTLLVWVVLTLTLTEPDSPLSEGANPLFDERIKPLLVYYACGHHAVNLNPVAISPETANLLGDPTIAAVIEVGARHMDGMCAGKFLDLMTHASRAQELTKLVKVGIAHHTADDWEQKVRAAHFLRGAQLTAAYLDFVNDTHSEYRCFVRTPISGGGIRNHLAEYARLTPSETRIFFATMDIVAGICPLATTIESTTSETQEQIMMASDMYTRLDNSCCGYCATVTANVKHHCRSVQSNAELVGASDFIDNYHKDSQRLDKIYCVACGAVFKNRLERNAHMNAKEGDCRRSQTSETRESHARLVKILVQAWVAAYNAFLFREESLGTPMTLDALLRCATPPPNISIATVVACPRVRDFLGPAATLLDAGFPVTVASVALAIVAPAVVAPPPTTIADTYVDYLIGEVATKIDANSKTIYRDLCKSNSCYCCNSEFAGSSRFTCGHYLCSGCAHEWCKTSIVEFGDHALKFVKRPTCFCGACLPPKLVASAVPSYAACISSVPDLKDRISTHHVIRCNSCKKWSANQPLVSGGDGPPPRAQPRQHRVSRVDRPAQHVFCMPGQKKQKAP